MTEEDPIWAALHRVFRDVLEDDQLELTPDTTARDVEGWDSLTTVEIMVGLEKELGIRFTTGEMATLADVGGLVVRLRELRGVREEGAGG